MKKGIRNAVGLELNSKKYFITTLLSAFDEKCLKFSLKLFTRP